MADWGDLRKPKLLLMKLKMGSYIMLRSPPAASRPSLRAACTILSLMVGTARGRRISGKRFSCFWDPGSSDRLRGVGFFFELEV